MPPREAGRRVWKRVPEASEAERMAVAGMRRMVARAERRLPRRAAAKPGTAGAE